MPTYEYRCFSCGHVFEKFQSITSGALQKCPECGKFQLKRLIGSGSGVIFKGADWPGRDISRKEERGRCGTKKSNEAGR